MATVSEGIDFAGITGGETLAREAIKRSTRNGDMCLIDAKKSLWDSLASCGCLNAIALNQVFSSPG